MNFQDIQDNLSDLGTKIHNNGYYYLTSALCTTLTFFQVAGANKPGHAVAFYGLTFLTHLSTDILVKQEVLSPNQKIIIDNGSNFFALTSESALRDYLSTMNADTMITAAIKKGFPLVANYYVIGGMDQAIEWINANNSSEIANDSKAINYAGKHTFAQPVRFAFLPDTLSSSSAMNTCLAGVAGNLVKSLSTLEQRTRFLGTPDPETQPLRAALFDTNDSKKLALSKTKYLLDQVIKASDFDGAKKAVMTSEVAKVIKSSYEKSDLEELINHLKEGLAKGLAAQGLSHNDIKVLQHDAEYTLKIFWEMTPGAYDYVCEGILALVNEGAIGCVFTLLYGSTKLTGSMETIVTPVITPALRALEDSIRILFTQEGANYCHKQLSLPYIDDDALMYYNTTLYPDTNHTNHTTTVELCFDDTLLCYNTTPHPDTNYTTIVELCSPIYCDASMCYNTTLYPDTNHTIKVEL